MYLGPSEKALEYFENLGMPCPPRVNPPDHFMDCIGGIFPEEFKKVRYSAPRAHAVVGACLTTCAAVAQANPDFTPEDLFTKWEEFQASGGAPVYNPPAPHPPSAAELKAVNRHAANVGTITFLSLKRAMWQHARSKVVSMNRGCCASVCPL